MTIRIKKRSQPGWLLWLIMILPFLLGTLNDLLRLPNAIRYLLDLCWIALTLYLMLAYSAGRVRNTKSILFWVTAFFVYTLLAYIVQYQSFLYYLWGLRNIFRFYVVFLAAAAFWKSDDIDGFIRLIEKLYVVNVVVSLIQYYGLGIKGDYLGGIFGTEQGCNGYTTIFNMIVVIKTIVFYLENRESVWRCLMKCVAALYIAALAELKFFFVIFVVITLLALLFTKFTWKKILLILGGSVGIALGTALLAQLFSGDENWFTLEWMMDVVASDRGYTSAGDLNRLNSIPQINELWLRNWGQRIFGLGLGNCDMSSFAFLNTPFYRANGAMHYTWISYAFMYLECGWIGLVFYYGFFIQSYFRARKVGRKSEGIAKTYCRVSSILAVCCMMLTVYNASLRVEAGYMAYLVLAIPFVIEREKKVGVHHAEKAAAEPFVQREGFLR